jgi:hypothetical protein
MPQGRSLKMPLQISWSIASWGWRPIFSRAPRPLFDVILSSPPSFPGEPSDIADRAWFAGPNYRDIASLFDQARERLAPDGSFYILLSSDSDLVLLGASSDEQGSARAESRNDLF